MPVAISFRDVSHLNFLDGFSCGIGAGSSALIVTSREDESTALTRLVTGLSRPDRGSVLIDGQDLACLEADQLHRLRRQIGIVPADGGLVSNLKVWENITLPLMYHVGQVTAEEERTALAYLERLGYSGRVMALPAHLTHHERRTVALVRMLMSQPRIMLYSNCIDGAPSAARNTFLQVAGEFHTAVEGRTSLYLTSAPELADELQVDIIINVKESVATVSRNV